jgi:hypothetical protein
LLAKSSTLPSLPDLRGVLVNHNTPTPLVSFASVHSKGVRQRLEKTDERVGEHAKLSRIVRHVYKNIA